MLHADVNAALQQIDTTLYGDLPSVQEQLRREAVASLRSSAHFLFTSLIRHGLAYYAGYISADRVVDILIKPFLKLANSVNLAVDYPAGSAPHDKRALEFQDGMRSTALSAWNSAVQCTLQGIWDVDYTEKLIPGFTNQKRSKMGRAAVEAGFIQVDWNNNISTKQISLGFPCLSSVLRPNFSLQPCNLDYAYEYNPLGLMLLGLCLQV